MVWCEVFALGRISNSCTSQFKKQTNKQKISAIKCSFQRDMEVKRKMKEQKKVFGTTNIFPEWKEDEEGHQRGSSPHSPSLSQAFPVLRYSDLQPEMVRKEKRIWCLAAEDGRSSDREAAVADQQQGKGLSPQPPQ